MFKKSLLALAFAGAALSANAANTLPTTTTYKISSQSLTAAKTANTATVAVTLDDTFDGVILAGAKMVVTISGAVFNSGITADLVGAGTATVASTADPVNAGSTLTYVLTKTGNIADGDTITIPVLPIILDDVSGTVSYTVSFLTAGNAALSSADTATKTVATIANEWVATYTVLDEEIDVANDKEIFVGGTTLADTLVIALTDIDTGSAVSDADELVFTVYGDMSGIASISDGTNAYVIDTTANTAVYTYSLTNDTDLSNNGQTLTFNLEAASADRIELAERDFTADVRVKYNTNLYYNIADGKAAGGWEFNSSSIVMDYVPMGSNTQVIVNATSTFAEDASVDVSYLSLDADGDVETIIITDVATVTPGTVTKLGDAIETAILTSMGTTSGKTQVTVSVNAPAGTVSFFTGFTNISDGSRMALVQNTTTEADAAAIKLDLANTTDGLGKLSTDIASGNLTSTNAARVAVVKAIVDAKTADANEVYASGDLAGLNATCALIDTTFTFVVDAAGASTDVADGGASAATNVCALDD